MKITDPVKKAKTYFFLTIATLSFPLLVVKANDGTYGLNETANTAFGGGKPFEGDSLPEIIGTIIGAALSFIGILFFVLIIYGGITWMTAAGNENQISKAKSLIISAIIGLIIVLAAYAITSFIGGALT